MPRRWITAGADGGPAAVCRYCRPLGGAGASSEEHRGSAAGFRCQCRWLSMMLRPLGWTISPIYPRPGTTICIAGRNSAQRCHSICMASLTQDPMM